MMCLSDIKDLAIKKYKTVAEAQIIGRGSILATQLGQLPWIINIRYCKKVVIDTEIWASCYTMKKEELFERHDYGKI